MTEALGDFVEHELWLSDRQPDGATREANLESAWRQTGRMPPELAPVECPHEVLYLWGYFLSLNERRSSNGYAVNPISNAEVRAWQQRTGVELDLFEQAVLDRFEQLYLRHHMPKPTEPTK